MKFLRAIGRALIGFFREDGLMLAGSISYFGMMALVPFGLFLVSVFGHILGSYPEFYKFFQGRLSSLFPAAAAEISGDIVKIISHKGLGKLSLLLYGVLSYQLFAALETSLNAVFRIKKRRPLFHSVVVSVVVATLVVLMIVISFAAATAVTLITALKHYFPGAGLGGLTAFTVGYVVPFFMVLVTLTAVYRILPKAPVTILNAFRGAFFTTAFLEMAKHIFTWYVVSVAPFGKVYGSLTAFVVFLLWIFYSSCLFLIGAGIVYNLGNARKARGET